MTDQKADFVQTEIDSDRRAWNRPEVRRIAAGEAEAVGAVGSDGVIGAS
jgi:hypothetical protein